MGEDSLKGFAAAGAGAQAAGLGCMSLGCLLILVPVAIGLVAFLIALIFQIAEG